MSLPSYNAQSIIVPSRKLYKLADFLPDTFEVKDVNDRQMSGYVSTDSIDLVNDRIPPSAYEKHLFKYQKNPVYCWMHDHERPIGHVKNVYCDDKGLYLDDITLSDIPLVRDILWPMIKDGTLRQQSVGFLSLDGEFTKGVYVHKEVYMLESSLVTVACNPDAMLDQVKALVKHLDGDVSNYDWSNPQAFLEAYYKGEMPSIDDITKTFSMYQPTKSVSADVNVELPEEKDTSIMSKRTMYVVTQETAKYSPESAVKPMPKPFEKAYTEVAPSLYAAKRVNGEIEEFVFPIGYPTEDGGVQYSYELTAIALSKLFGARGALEMTAEEKGGICTRLCNIYRTLGKQIPTYLEVPLDMIEDAVIDGISFGAIEFHNGEKSALESAWFGDAQTNAANIFKSLIKSPDTKDKAFESFCKYVYAGFEVYVSLYDEEDAATIMRLVEALLSPEEEDGAKAEAIPSAYDAEKELADTEKKNVDELEGEPMSDETFQALSKFVNR